MTPNMSPQSALHNFYRWVARSDIVTTGAVLLRNQLDHVVRYHFSNSFKTCEQAEALLLQTVGVHVKRFIDVGANVGRFAGELLRVSPNVQSGLLIDPSKSAVQALREKFGSDTRLEIVEAACGDAAGEAVFHEEPNAGETSTLVAGAVRAPGITRAVRVTTIDDEVAARGWTNVDLIKIDAEGYDLHVMRGMVRLVQRQAVGIIQFEYNSSWKAACSLLSEAISLLQKHNYQVFFMSNEGLRRANYARFGEYFSFSNYVAIAADRLEGLKDILR